MRFSCQELTELVGRASTIDERLSSVFSVRETAVDEGAVDERLARWCQVVAKGNLELFSRRLDRNGWTEPMVHRALGRACLADEQSLPGWAWTLNGLVEECESTADCAERERFLASDEALPFEEVFAPFVRFARRKLLGRDGRKNLLSERAQTALERNLLQRLSQLCASILELEFSVYRARLNGVQPRWLSTEAGSQSTRLYREFVRELLTGQLRSFFQ